MPATPIMSTRPTGGPRWWRAIAASMVLHVIGAALAVVVMKRGRHEAMAVVDVDIAPSSPAVETLPREVAAVADRDGANDNAAPTAAVLLEQRLESADLQDIGADAGVVRADAAVAPDDAVVTRADVAVAPEDTAVTRADAAVAPDDTAATRADAAAVIEPHTHNDETETASKHRPRDAAPSAGSAAAAQTEQEAPVSVADAGIHREAVDVAVQSAGSAATLSDAGSASSGPTTAQGSGEAIGASDLAAVEGAPTSAGTAANLLSYVPSGHVVTALVRFDRLRDTEWAVEAETLLRTMPDYRALFGDRDAAIRSKLDMLVISSPRPRDATATTLVMKTHEPRSHVRELLANSATPIAWSTAQGGLVGKRRAGLRDKDRRIVMSPWQRWYLLTGPDDLGDLMAPVPGDLDVVEATGKLPPWLSKLRTIEIESGGDRRGPAFVVTMDKLRTAAGIQSRRYALPGVGLGADSLPVPLRASLAMELVKLGWLARGYLAFSTEAEASEFVHSVTAVQQRIASSRLLSLVASQQHALNAIKGLALLRVGTRVSYSTSLSNADARAVLEVVATHLAEYFRPR